MALNRYMIGRVGVQVFVVSGPGELQIDMIDDLWIRMQVIEGLGFLRSLARGNTPPINVSFQVQGRRIGLDVPAAHLPLLVQNEAEVEAREAVWRDPMLAQLGLPRGTAGLRALIAAGRLDHSVVIFVTKYPEFAQAYGDNDDPFVVIDWDWVTDPGRGGKGFGRLGNVVAHEVGHTFDAPDEYAGCQLLKPDGSGFGTLDFPNFNCVDKNPDSVTCLMKRSADAEFACSSTRTHWGWVDSNQDGILDVFQL